VLLNKRRVRKVSGETGEEWKKGKTCKTEQSSSDEVVELPAVFRLRLPGWEVRNS